jgi:glucosamine kinase
LDVLDGLEPASGLSQHLLNQFSGSAEIVAFAAGASPMDFGALARKVTQQAKEGDLLARGLMQRGADYIAKTLPRIGWTADHALCLTGGLAAEYRGYLPLQMQQALKAPQGDPVSGALSLAREFAASLQGAPASGQDDD